MSLSAVARAAGVSVSTVSRYVKGELALKPETERVVLDAMHAVGFSMPHDHKRGSKVVLVMPELRNPYFANVAEAVTKACNERGLQALISVTGGIAHQERQLIDAAAHMDDIYGILYIGMTAENPALEAVAANVPVVVLDEPVGSGGQDRMPLVTADNFDGAFQATNYLIQQGHRVIAHAGGPEDLSSTRQRLRGYQEALAFHGISVAPELQFHGPYSETYGINVLTRIQRLNTQPTAIMAASDIVAIGIVSGAEQYGISIPQDLSIIGFDGISVGAWLRPKLTTVVQPVEGMISAAFEELRHLYEREDIRNHSLAMELRIRESCTKVNSDQ
ncbi:LacI family DNA-binding transcriptional regulator [Cutibacterium avidum]|uniref:LacI family DNA-binding transcriptional regulator n=1 Tax=Cutibacterium TaxID=1912216 RepID=UPI002FF38C06